MIKLGRQLVLPGFEMKQTSDILSTPKSDILSPSMSAISPTSKIQMKDGGKDYLKRGAKNFNNLKNLSEYEADTQKND